MKILKNLILILFFVTAPLFSSFVHAQNFPKKPYPIKFVNDFAKIYSAKEANYLEKKLFDYQNKTSSQIVIVTVTSLDGYPIDDYAIKLGEKWGVGQKGKNNGILILISAGDHKIFIATGYGVEGELNDGKIGTIIRSKIIPYFKNGNYFAGTVAGINIMTDALSEGLNAEDSYRSNHFKENLEITITWLTLLAIVIIVLVFKVRIAREYALLNRVLFLTAFSIIAVRCITWMAINMVIAILTGGKGKSSDSDFGGGSFGGGGASGSW